MTRLTKESWTKSYKEALGSTKIFFNEGTYDIETSPLI